jgi:hypothetical protein
MTALNKDLIHEWCRSFKREVGHTLHYQDFNPTSRPAFVLDLEFKGGEAHRFPALSSHVVGTISLTVWIATEATYTKGGENSPLSLFEKWVLPFFTRRYGLKPQTLLSHRINWQPEELKRATLWQRFDWTLREPFTLAIHKEVR